MTRWHSASIGVIALILLCGNALAQSGRDRTEPISHPLVEAGEFHRIYDPSVGESETWYINDHCFVRRDGVWHLFGITNHLPIISYDEDQFAHAIAASLTQSQWEKQPYALVADASQGETQLWAPHVIEHDDVYYMFYCAGLRSKGSP